MARKESPQLKKEISRAEQAKVVVGNPIFQESFSLMKDEIFKNWLRTAPTDVDSREWFHKLAVAAIKLEKLLAHHITTGTMASMAVEANRKVDERRRPTRRT